MDEHVVAHYEALVGMYLVYGPCGHNDDADRMWWTYLESSSAFCIVSRRERRMKRWRTAVFDNALFAGTQSQ
ncbi:unnamed protein product [Toxocara canis]|uniref:DUF4338 domain-containing protein n=1 Tax=Toxocara canis TaxID=6265 RepID=A0A183UN31_TOXCA|nr:unnamed protein product [Toxocara canis]